MKSGHGPGWENIKPQQIIRTMILVCCLVTLVVVKLWQLSVALYLLGLLCCGLLFFVDSFSAFICTILASGLVGLGTNLLPMAQFVLILLIWTTLVVRLVFFADQPHADHAQLKRELDRTKRELLDAQEITTRFANRVNHELRTPINLIVGFSEAIIDPYHPRESLPETYSEDIQVIYRNAKQLQTMIDALLDASKIEATATSWVQGSADPTILIREAIVLVQSLLNRRRLTLSLNIESLPTLQINPALFRQAILSLLKCAAHFTQNTRLDLDARIQDEALHIRLVGTTIPVAVYAQETNQQDEGASTFFSCKRIVAMYHGKLSLEPDASGKTVFSLTIPVGLPVPFAIKSARTDLLVLDEDPSVVNLFSKYITHYHVVGVTDIQTLTRLIENSSVGLLVLSSKRMHSQLPTIEQLVEDTIPIVVCSFNDTGTLLRDYNVDQLRKPITFLALSNALRRLSRPPQNVMVLDDNNEVVQLFCQMLSAIRPSSRIWTAYSGQEGLALLREQPVDLLILDMMLPDMDGLAIIQYARNDPQYKNTPIILISGTNPDEETRVTGQMTILDPALTRSDDVIRRIEAIAQILGTN